MRIENTMSYFNEYLFHQVLDQLNQSRLQENSPVVTVSQGRFYHRDFFARMNEDQKSFSKLGFDEFTGYLKDILPTDAAPFLTKEFYNQKVQDFTALMGPQNAQVTEFNFIPLSPYDERFSNRSVFLKNGSFLLYLKGTDYNPSDSNLEYAELYAKSGLDGYKKAGSSMTLDDYSGMSALMPFLSEADYKVVAPWVNMIGEKDHSIYMSPDAISRSCEILRALQEEGIEYTVSKDLKPGQIQANLKGTKIAIRLTDARSEEKYIGRVYDNGHSIYYTTNKRMPGKQNSMTYDSLSVKDTLRLLHFAQGKSVDRNDLAEPAGLVRSYQKSVKGVPTNFFDAYHSDKNYSSAIDTYPGDPSSKIFIHVDNKRTGPTFFKTEQDSDAFLQNAVETARRQFESQIELKQLRKSVAKYQKDPEFEPKFSIDPLIASIQQSYWLLLTGQESQLLIPQVTMDDFETRLKNVQDLKIQDPNFTELMLSDLVYHGSPEEQIQQHLKDSLHSLIGSFEPDEDGKRFHPSNVVTYMQSDVSQFVNTTNLVNAIKKSGIKADELRGSDFETNYMKSRLIEFDEATAVPMASIANPFVRDLFTEIKNTITQTGCDVKNQDILLDANGIVKYKAQMICRERGTLTDGIATKDVTGTIGQIFMPDDLGLIETKFEGLDNYLFTPGYEAYVLPQKEGEEKTMEERTRLRGYEQLMVDAIRYNLRSDLLTGFQAVGTNTSLNHVYRKVYDTRYPLDFMQQSHLDGMTDDLLKDIIATNAARVRFSNEFRDQSTINADYQASLDGAVLDPANDNYRNYYNLTGQRNIAVLSNEGDGYFDKDATGTNANQGITRYLVQGATVNLDGSITPSNPDDQVALMKNPVCKYMKYNPFDRRQMTFSNLLKASCVAPEIYTAQMTFGGWGFDDGYVVSKEFAEQFPIRDSSGKMRALMPGDKISDFNGNKGCISLVVDRNMDLEKAKQEKLLHAVEWFKANPDLSVVGAPFPALSRFNGGSARELMSNTKDLIAPDGSIHKGCMGAANYIITHMAVDEKTHIYEDEDVQQGKGRKVSAQLAWALAGLDAKEVLKACYHSNNSATSNLREYLIVCGLDLAPDGTLRSHYEPHNGEERQVLPMPELRYRTVKESTKLDLTNLKKEFGSSLFVKGGVMEVPFQLSYPNGNKIPPMNPEKTDVIYKLEEWERAGYTRKDGTKVKATTVRRNPNANTQRVFSSDETFGLPVLSSYLRSGQDFEDGTSVIHDYTNHYLKIFEASMLYKDAEKNQNSVEMEKQRNLAQLSYDQMTGDIINRKFSKSKHNLFRDSIMANRMSKSATAVWTADPRLDIDQIGMSPKMAEALGYKENDYTGIWRDPVLSTGGMRMFRVKIQEELVGVTINPVMDKSFDGDFDGDSVGLLNIPTKVALKEAIEKLSVGANLLDYGSFDKETGLFDLYMQDSLDLKSAAFRDPSLKARRLELTKAVNDFETTAKGKDLANCRAYAVQELNQLIQDSFDAEYGTDLISFDTMEAHLKSVEHMIIDGAKGNYAKLKDYANYLGVEFELAEEPDAMGSKIQSDSIQDCIEPLTNREDDLAVQYATAVKSFGTGVAGMFSQRGVCVLRNKCQRAVLGLTYPVTQSILQSKHDPIEARRKYELLMSTARDLWRGVKMERMVNAETGKVDWKSVKNEKGFGIQASPEEFKQQFIDIYTSADGLNVKVNEQYIHDICEALTTTNDHSGALEMMNLEKDGRSALAAPLDQLAYGGDFATLNGLAQSNRNLFEGEYNQYFAPGSIRRNWDLKAQGLTEKAIVKSDVHELAQPEENKDLKAVTIPNTKAKANQLCQLANEMEESQEFDRKKEQPNE